MCKCFKIFPALFIIIALALAVTISLWHEQGLTYIVLVSRFFDVMLPVLAVGALIKYLVTRHNSCNCDDSCGCRQSEKKC